MSYSKTAALLDYHQEYLRPKSKPQFPNGNSVSFVSTTNTARSLAGPAKRHVHFTPNSDRKTQIRAKGHVCFAPESGHVLRKHRCLLRAKSGHTKRLQRG